MILGYNFLFVNSFKNSYLIVTAIKWVLYIFPEKDHITDLKPAIKSKI